MLEPANVYGNQDCWPKTTHLIAMSKDPSSLMDIMALEGNIGRVGALIFRSIGFEAK